MSGRRFDVADVAEVLVMWQGGKSARDIARTLGMGRDRIRAIVRRAVSHGYLVASDPLSRDEWLVRVATLFSERAAPAGSAQRQELEQFREAIERGLERDSAATVWQRLRDEHGINVALRTFRRYASDLRAAYPDHDGTRTALVMQLSAARKRISELEAQLTSHRPTAHLRGDATYSERHRPGDDRDARRLAG